MSTTPEGGATTVLAVEESLVVFCSADAFWVCSFRVSTRPAEGAIDPDELVEVVSELEDVSVAVVVELRFVVASFKTSVSPADGLIVALLVAEVALESVVVALSEVRLSKVSVRPAGGVICRFRLAT